MNRATLVALFSFVPNPLSFMLSLMLLGSRTGLSNMRPRRRRACRYGCRISTSEPLRGPSSISVWNRSEICGEPGCVRERGGGGGPGPLPTMIVGSATSNSKFLSPAADERGSNATEIYIGSKVIGRTYIHTERITDKVPAFSLPWVCRWCTISVLFRSEPSPTGLTYLSLALPFFVLHRLLDVGLARMYWSFFSPPHLCG